MTSLSQRGAEPAAWKLGRAENCPQSWGSKAPWGDREWERGKTWLTVSLTVPEI